MQFELTAILFALSFLGASSSPIYNGTLDEREAPSHNCVVNAIERSTWVEAGLNRHRYAFSSQSLEAGYDIDNNRYCQIWRDSAGLDGGSNVQCWSDSPDWWVDCSFARGPAGDLSAENIRDMTLRHWMFDTGCRTGH